MVIACVLSALRAGHDRAFSDCVRVFPPCEFLKHRSAGIFLWIGVWRPSERSTAVVDVDTGFESFERERYPGWLLYCRYQCEGCACSQTTLIYLYLK